MEITNKELAALKSDAQNIINDTDLANMNRNSYMMLGASLAILNHHIPKEHKEHAAKEQDLKMERGGKYSAAIAYADDEYDDAEKYAKIGENGLASDELRHMQHWIEKARGNARTKDELADVEDLQRHHDRLYDKIHAEQ